MTWRRVVAWAVAVALVAGYGYRAVNGGIAGWAFVRGSALFSAGDYRAAAVLLERAAIGSLRLRGVREAAEARLDRWDDHVAERGATGADLALLNASAAGFLQCRCIAPASRWSWEGLGEAYDGLEWVGRESRVFGGLGGGAGWGRVGRPGRVAIGLMRGALELAPNWYRIHDKLALTLWSYGLEAESENAMRDAARVLPVFGHHGFGRVPDLPKAMVEAFAAQSWEVVGEVPLVSLSTHLLDLGKLEHRLGSPERAARAFERSLAGGRGNPTDRAEVRFYLGIALLDADRVDEGRAMLEQSSEHPLFRVPALETLVRLAKRSDDPLEALERLRQLREEDPRNLDYCLDFAEVARGLEQWPAASEALRWARLLHPDDPRPVTELVELSVVTGDLTTASELLAELEGRVTPEEVARLRRELDAAGR